MPSEEKNGAEGVTKGRMEWKRRRCREVEVRVVVAVRSFWAQKTCDSRFLFLIGLKKLASGDVG